MRGVELDTNTDAITLIRERVQENGFVGVSDTVSRFREFYHAPDIFRQWTLGRWQSEGRPSILDEAWTRAQEEIDGPTFTLEDGQQQGIDRIHTEGTRYVLDSD